MAKKSKEERKAARQAAIAAKAAPAKQANPFVGPSLPAVSGPAQLDSPEDVARFLAAGTTGAEAKVETPAAAADNKDASQAQVTGNTETSTINNQEGDTNMPTKKTPAEVKSKIIGLLKAAKDQFMTPASKLPMIGGKLPNLVKNVPIGGMALGLTAVVGLVLFLCTRSKKSA